MPSKMGRKLRTVMLGQTLALAVTVVPGVAAADVAVDVHLRTPAMRVSVATGPVYTSRPAEMQPPAPSPHHVWIAGAWAPRTTAGASGCPAAG